MRSSEGSALNAGLILLTNLQWILFVLGEDDPLGTEPLVGG
jgi:hypothetical protein